MTEESEKYENKDSNIKDFIQDFNNEYDFMGGAVPVTKPPTGNVRPIYKAR
jgi:hypothetical protein